MSLPACLCGLPIPSRHCERLLTWLVGGWTFDWNRITGVCVTDWRRHCQTDFPSFRFSHLVTKLLFLKWVLLQNKTYKHFNIAGSESNDMAIDTNALEVSTPYLKYWSSLHNLLRDSVAINGETNVVTGPVRDSPSSGQFFVVSTCLSDASLGSCRVEELDVQSFILPTNARYSRDCFGTGKYLSTHVATIPDIEHTTGIRLFPNVSYGDKLHLTSRSLLSSKLLVNPDPAAN